MILFWVLLGVANHFIMFVVVIDNLLIHFTNAIKKKKRKVY